MGNKLLPSSTLTKKNQDKWKYHRPIGIMIVGEGGVGKTTLSHVFADGKFSEGYPETIGVDFKAKRMCVDGEYFRAQIWDTAGKERFRTVIQNIYNYSKTIKGYIILFALNDRKSFDAIPTFVTEIKKRNPNGLIFIAKNKCDVSSTEIAVTEDEIQSLSESLGIKVFNGDAKKEEVVNALMESCYREILKKEKTEPKDSSQVDYQ